jgi:hypothetical protein
MSPARHTADNVVFARRAGFRAAVCAGVAALLLTTAQSALAAPPTERDREVDESVARALEFLSTKQDASGAWEVDTFGESTAITSLAVMAYMAAGHVPGEGPYGDKLARGIDWVIAQQKPNGLIVSDSTHGPFYSHGISTLMLAEAAGMVDARRAKPVREALEKAVRLILEAQSVTKIDGHDGGWRYQATSLDSDLSVSGWQVLALRAAKNIGCDVPAESIERAVDYIKRCSVGGNRGFAYQPGGSPTATRTGTGILALEICGDHQSAEALGGVEALREQPLRFDDTYFFYGAYYCSVGLFQIGGDDWERGKRQIYELLLEHQREDGSWVAEHGSEKSAGKIYCTSMAILALAVEYRYLPIYQR